MTKRFVWLAVGLALVLMLTATAMARLPSNQTASRGIYIQYDSIFDNIDRANGFPVAGGHKRWMWKELEPTRGSRLFDSEIRTFVQQQASRGKKAALGLETFVGRINQTGPNGALGVPDWLWITYPSSRLYNTVSNDGWYVLNYLDSNYKARYAEFISALADWLAANPDVASNVGWIEMGVGMYSETQPSDQWVTKNAKDYDYYANRAPGGESPPGWTGNDWLNHVRWAVDTYVNAFRVRNTNLSHIALFLNCAPDYKGTRNAFTDYAAIKGVGLKNNGLQVDRHPWYLYSPLEKWWGASGVTLTVPIAWETYEQWLTNETELYWGLLCAMDKHPDVMEPDRWLMVDQNKNKRVNYVAIWNWIEPYIGVTVDTTPGIWCALRETEYPSNGEPGNFNFYLFQAESYGNGGATVATFNQGYKEGRYTRRTDQATGNTNMWFRIADTYENGNAARRAYTVYVTYLDRGNDTWQLVYDSFTGSKSAGTVVKTNSNTWKKATFTLTDARFGNGIGTQSDFRLDCNNDGDDYFHLVEIKRGSGGTTPTPTLPPTSATIQGNVQLQGRPAAPNAQWAVPLVVTVGGTPYSVTTDQSGNFTVSGITPGMYSIRVKNSHTLANIKNNVSLVSGSNPVNLGTLKEGDADNNNFVNITDFSILKSGFTPAFDPRADFNHDSVVNISDFSLLKTNFLQGGDIVVTSLGSMNVEGYAVSEGTVVVKLVPASASVAKDEYVNVDIQVVSGGQMVDGAEIHLNFSPEDLLVVDEWGNPATSIQGGASLDVPLLNLVDNAMGRIEFAAGTFSSTPPDGTFTLATVRLKALWATDHTSTHLTFSTVLPRKTEVTFAGVSVIGSTEDGTITSGELYRIYLPFAR